MNENDNIQYLYDNLKKNNYLTEGSIDDFRAYLEDEGNRQSLYDNLKKKNFLTEGSVDDFNAWLGIGQQPAPRVDVSDVEQAEQANTPVAQQAQRPSYEEWYKTVPADRNDTTSYDLRRAYELAPMEQLEKWRTASAEDLAAGKNHLHSAYENPETGEYEFVKRKDHPTIQMELDWYNSDDPEAVEFRKKYALDKSGDYYKYVPRGEEGTNRTDRTDKSQAVFNPNRMGGVGGEQNYMPQQTNYIEQPKKVLNEEETDKIETLNNLDNTLGEIKQKRRQGFWKTVGGMFGDIGISSAIAEGGMSYEDQEQLRKVQDDIRKTNSVNMAINQNLHDAENTLNIARKNIEEGEGSVAVKLGRGVRYANLDNVIPVSELYGQMGVLQLYDKLNEDGTPKEPLTEDEQTLYEALALNQYVQQAFGGDINMLNRIGRGLPEQAMFTLSFLLSSEFAGAQAIGNGATKALQRGISKGIKREIKTGLGRFMLDKALPTAFGMGAETLYRTGLQVGNIAEGAIERHVGNIRIDPETGEIGGFENGVDWGEAVWKSAASVANENATELLGDKVFEPGWAWLGRNTKAGKKIADFRKAIGKMGNGKVDDILKMGNSISEKAGWQGWAFETLEELAGNFNDAAFIHDQTWEQAFSKETLMETTLNCMIFGMAMGTSTTSLQALRNMPSAVETRNTKRLASSIIGRMDDISTDDIDWHIENDNANDLSQWLVARHNLSGWTDVQRTAVANYVRATVAQKAQRNFKDMQLQEEVNAMEERVDDMTNRQSGDVIEANFMVDGQMQTGTIVGGRVSVVENDVMDVDGNPRQAYIYNPNLSSVTVTVRMEDGTKKQISARDIESINSVTDAEQYKAERTQELTQAMQDSVKSMYEPPTLSEIWGTEVQPGAVLNYNGGVWTINGYDEDADQWTLTQVNPDGTPINDAQTMTVDGPSFRTMGLLEKLNAMQQQGASEEEMDDVVSDLNAEEGLKNIEASDNEDNIWDAVAGFMQGYFKTNEEGDPIPEESRPEAVAGYLVALQKGDIGKTIGIVDARIAELQTRLTAKPEQVENNGEGVVGMAANQSLADSAAEDIKKEIGFLEMVRDGLVAKQEEQAQMKAQQPVSQMDAGTEFPVDWNGTPAVAVVEGRDADGRNLVTVYDANDRDGLPLQAGIEVSENDDAEWEARRVRPQEQTEQPPMESAGNGTEQVEPEPQPQSEPTLQPTPAPVQPEPAPQQEHPQAEYPKDKQGKPQYDMIDDPNVFLQALVDEWGEDALGVLDDIIEDTKEGLEQKSKLEQRRIKKRLAMLEQVRGILSPNEVEETPTVVPTVVPTETPAEPVDDGNVNKSKYFSNVTIGEYHDMPGDDSEKIADIINSQGIKVGEIHYDTEANKYSATIYAKESVFTTSWKDNTNDVFDSLDNYLNEYNTEVVEWKKQQPPMESAGEGTEQTPIETTETPVEETQTEQPKSEPKKSQTFEEKALAIPGITFYEERSDGLEIGTKVSTVWYPFTDYDKSSAQLEQDKQLLRGWEKKHDDNVLLLKVKSAGDEYATEYCKRNGIGMASQLSMDWNGMKSQAKGELKNEALYRDVLIPYFEERARKRAEQLKEEAQKQDKPKKERLFEDGNGNYVERESTTDDGAFEVYSLTRPDDGTKRYYVPSSADKHIGDMKNGIGREEGQYDLFGDTIFNTLDEALEYADNSRKRYEADKEAAKKREQEEKGEEERQKAEEERKRFDGFTDGMPKMKVEKVAATLDKKWRFDGEVMTMGEYVKKCVNDGKQFDTYKDGSKTEYFVRIDDNGTIFKLTKTAYDYAKFLEGQGKQAESEPLSLKDMIDASDGHVAVATMPKTEQAGPTDSSVAAANEEVDTNPTEAQKEAGNYKKGHVTIDGFDISIENPAGSTRSGTDAQGNPWSVTMHNSYGYIRMTEGVDGDHIDVFLSDHIDDWNGTVYVVDQVNEDGSFDEHKVMYGFNDMEEARKAYLSNYSEGWNGLGSITPVSKEEFKKWIDSSHRKTKPFSEYRSVKTEGDVLIGTNETTMESRTEGTEQQPTASAYGANNTLVSQERYEELKRRMKEKLGGQMNMGVDPEILSIGVQMAVYHIEAGARKFADFCKNMVADLGDAIRPYLKAFYNGARDLPEIEEAGYLDELTPYDEVKTFDVNGFDKGGSSFIETAQEAVKENEVEQQKKEAEDKLKKNKKNKPQGGVVELVASSLPEDQEILNGSRNDEETENGDKFTKEQKQAFSRSVASDMITALATGEKPYRSIVDVRKKAQSMGMDVDAEGRDDIVLQELVEYGLVTAARDVVESGHYGGSKSNECFDAICKLYEMQPTISMRSSNRVKMQQYSTPLPMAFVADMFAYKGGKVLEPTAGNGMLVFAVPANKVIANELDETRLDNLKEQGFDGVFNNDALTADFNRIGIFVLDKPYDSVIANPPFGSSPAKDYDGKMISGLDEQITLNALSAMKDDGMAAIIIGGNMEYGKNGGISGNRAFWTYLYDHYNVKGVMDMDGKLYGRQGTSYPTRMILIDGRRSEEERAQTTVFPPVKQKAVRKAESFDDLYDIVTELLSLPNKTNGNEVLRDKPPVSDTDRPQGNTATPRPRKESNANDSNVGETGGRRDGDTGDTTTAQGGVRQAEGGSGGVDAGQRPASIPGTQANQSWNETPADNGRSDTHGTTERVSDGSVQGVGDAASGVGLSEPKPQEKRTLTEEKLPYRQHNSAFSLQSVAPAAMVEAMDKALAEIEKTYGKSIDEFVTEELGYDSVEDMHNALAAEQVDSVAMAIHQMKQGQAMIIGDQTGVGKGRQMAALIRWAYQRGEKPIFVTQKADLFSDIYRDLVDIGSGDLKPFIFNSDGAIVDADGNVVHKPLSATEQRKVFDKGELPDGYDFAVLTYSQVNTGDAQSREEARQAVKANGGRAGKKEDKPRPSPKADFLRKIAKDNYLFLDESHTAAGSSNTGYYLQSLLRDAKSATFASATFAKRPDTMPLYAIRTAMSQANVKPNELIGIIEKGGVTLQEIMSRALTDAGQMVRRERDMSDVQTDWITISDEKTVKKARENYDKTIAAFNAIIKFQQLYVKPMIAALDNELAAVASSADVKKGTDKMGVENVPFASKTYNYTKQLMLALKVDAIADKVEEEVNAGRHPVIALESTMEASIKDYSVGDIITEPTFSASLLRGLDTVMQYTVKDENGQESHQHYTPEQLGEEGEKAYYALQDFIRKSTSEIFISPLDAIIERLQEKGYKVGELTGRNMYVERDDKGRVVVKRRTDKDKKRMQREFNSGELDVLILNKSASTGISLHASEKFSDQRQRTMVIAQPLSDINDYMQMIGRIDRTGQVHRGYYINLGLPVPAENRFLMMLSTKLKSLNANTTTSQESESNSVEAPDLLNKYGSQVVVEYLRDNPEIYEKMGEPLRTATGTVKTSDLDDYKAPENDEVVRKITGYVALLTTKEQEEFYNDVVKRYTDLIKYLNDTGTNDLKITVMPLKAKTLEKKVSSKGVDPSGSNPFAQNAYVETVEMDVLRKPMKAEEVRKTIEQLNTPKGTEHGHLATAAKEKTAGERVMEIVGTVQREAKEKLQAENERYEEAKKKAVEDIEKQRAKINKQQKRSDEEKAEAIEKYITETNAKVEEQHQRNVMKIELQQELLEEKLGKFRVGGSYLVPDMLESESLASAELASPAIFCGFKAKDSKVTASTTFAVFATLDGRRCIDVKLSDNNAVNSIYNITESNYDKAQEVTLDNWDSKLPTNTRKTGYIMTGNILQAVKDTQDQNGNYPGQLISYTDDNGNVHDGILMPDKWQPAMLRNSGVPINAVMPDIAIGKPVKSTDGKVGISGRITPWEKIYTLTVPKTKKEGAMYFENPVILNAISGRGFWERGGEFRADINGLANLQTVVDELARLGVRVEAKKNQEQELYREGEGNEAKDTAQSIRDKANDTIKKLGLQDRVTILDSTEGLTGKRKKAKGWFDTKTGKIVIVMPNHNSPRDVVKTILHEGVAHYGLRQLVGEKNMNEFLDRVFEAADKEVRGRIIDLAMNKYDRNFRKATEEYLAGLAEDTNFDNPTFLEKVKALLVKLLDKMGIQLGKGLTDNELRYILWKSYRNLVADADSLTEIARDAVMQSELEVGDFAQAVAAESMAREDNDGDFDPDDNGGGITPEQDAAYMDAVNRGDMKTAQRMVDYEYNEYIKNHSYSREDVAKLFGGILENVEDDFEVFGIRFDERLLVPESVFPHSHELYQDYMENEEGEQLYPYGEGPYAGFYDAGELDGTSTVYVRNESDILKALEERYDGRYVYLVGGDNQGEGTDRNEILIDNAKVLSVMSIPNKKEGNKYNTIYHEQFTNKSQDPVTYDDEGNVIPLSQRFNEEDDDIRFRDAEPANKVRDEFDEISGAHPKDKAETLRQKTETFLTNQVNKFRPLKQLEELMAKTLGRNVRDSEAVYSRATQMAGRTLAQMEAEREAYLTPLSQAVNDVLDIIDPEGRRAKRNASLHGFKYEAMEEVRQQLSDYLIAKHGLERSEWFYQQKLAEFEEKKKDPAWMAAQQAKYDALSDDKKASMTFEEYIENKKPKWKDMGGLTGLAESLGEDPKKHRKVAENLVAEFEKKIGQDAIDRLWGAINDLNNRNLEIQYESGRKTKEEYEELKARHQYYVPLTGFDEETSDDRYTYEGNVQTLGDGLYRAKGRRSKPADPLVAMMHQQEHDVIWSNDNWAKDALLNAAINMNSDLLSVSQSWYVYNDETEEWEERLPEVDDTMSADKRDAVIKQFEADMKDLQSKKKAKRHRGRLNVGVRVLPKRESQHEVEVWRGGKRYIVYVNGNPSVVRAYSESQKELDNFTKGLAKANRIEAQLFTTYNPEFAVKNMMRDTNFALFSAFVLGGRKQWWETRKNIDLSRRVLPHLMKDGKVGPMVKDPAERQQLEQWYKEFIENGGETGFTRMMTAEQVSKDLNETLFELATDGKNAITKVQDLAEKVQTLNRWAENSTRFAAYITARQRGESVRKSMDMAKNSTLNFNIKGYEGRRLRAWFAFFNARLQGVAQLARLASGNKQQKLRFAAGLGAAVLTGAMVPFLNILLMGLFGDDDDWRTYENLSEFTGNNNLILFIPGIHKFIQIPYAQELAPFSAIGNIWFREAMGWNRNKSAWQQELEMALAYLPMEVSLSDKEDNSDWWLSTLARTASPTILQPTVEYLVNENFMNMPLRRDSKYKSDLAAWTRAYENRTSSALINASKWLNGGGSKNKWGKFEFLIDPSFIQHVMEGTAGGAGSFIGNARDLFTEPDWFNHLPFVRKFMFDSDPKKWQAGLDRAYSSYAYDLVEKYDGEIDAIRKDNNISTLEYARKMWEESNSVEAELYNTAKYYRDELGKKKGKKNGHSVNESEFGNNPYRKKDNGKDDLPIIGINGMRQYYGDLKAHNADKAEIEEWRNRINEYEMQMIEEMDAVYYRERVQNGKKAANWVQRMVDNARGRDEDWWKEYGE